MEENYTIYAKNINKTFKNFWGNPKVHALINVDLAVKKGSTFGLLGPNGAGKSTLIKLILGHLHPTSGKLAVLNKSPRNVQTKFQMGYLPEHSHFYKSLTATETLHYFGRLLNLDKKQIKNRTQQLLEMVGLSQAKSRPIGDYSHGMTRRIGLAQVLLNDPELIILDEPTGGLDPLGCREIKDLILNLKKRGKTILITSHILSDIEDVCDEASILFGGKVQTSGSINEMLTNQAIQQLRFNKVNSDKLEQIINALKQLGIDDINISSTHQNLETFFLTLIEKKAKEVKSTGAEISHGIAQYLKQEQITSPEELISQQQKEEALNELIQKDKIEEENNINKEALDDLTK